MVHVQEALEYNKEPMKLQVYMVHTNNIDLSDLLKLKKNTYNKQFIELQIVAQN